MSRQRTKRARRWVEACLLLLGVVFTLAGIKFTQVRVMLAAAKSQVRPPISVATTEVEQVEWQPTLEAVGTVAAVRGVTLGAEVTGTVRRIEFQNGATIDAGQTLVQLDSSAEQARLRSALAQEKLAVQNLRRARILRRQDINTQADLQTAQAAEKQARAGAANLRATIAKKTILAPFAGKVGIRQVELGEVVSPGTPIVSLQTVSPIHVDFWLPEQAIAQVEVGDPARVTVDVFRGSSWEGAVETISPEVDPKTRNVRIRATLPNPDGRLEPGMFADVSVSVGEPRQVLIIPQTAIVYAPYGDSVFVLQPQTAPALRGGQARNSAPRRPRPAVKNGPVAHQRFVRLGQRRGDYVVVASGLARGESVVSMGAFKLEEGDRVAVNNALVPHFSLHPVPHTG